MRANEYGKERPVGVIDIYYISNWEAKFMAKSIIEAKRTVEAILGNDAGTAFTIHSHSASNPDYEKKVLQYLKQFPEYFIVNPDINYRWYDTSSRFFNFLNPDSIL